MIWSITWDRMEQKIPFKENNPHRVCKTNKAVYTLILVSTNERTNKQMQVKEIREHFL